MGRREVSPYSGGVDIFILRKFWIFYRLIMPLLTDYLSFVRVKLHNPCQAGVTVSKYFKLKDYHNITFRYHVSKRKTQGARNVVL
jgi:hypothetical protein